MNIHDMDEDDRFSKETAIDIEDIQYDYYYYLIKLEFSLKNEQKKERKIRPTRREKKKITGQDKISKIRWS